MGGWGSALGLSRVTEPSLVCGPQPKERAQLAEPTPAAQRRMARAFFPSSRCRLPTTGGDDSFAGSSEHMVVLWLCPPLEFVFGLLFAQHSLSLRGYRLEMIAVSTLIQAAIVLLARASGERAHARDADAHIGVPHTYDAIGCPLSSLSVHRFGAFVEMVVVGRRTPARTVHASPRCCRPLTPYRP